MKDCIFCKLANGELPTHTVYEDEDFRVIFDLSPATRGHALVIPKVHYSNIFDLDEQVAAKAFVLAKKIATAMKEALKCDGFNIIQNNGEIAGQTIFHFHLHLIPRYKNDNMPKLWKPGKSTEDELVKLETLIKTRL